MPPTPRRSALVWNTRAGRYQEPRTGRFVGAATVRADLDRALAESGQAMTRLGAQLQAGEISLVEWELSMRQVSKDVAIYSAAVAKGGMAQLNGSDLGRIGASVRRTYGRLDAFSRQIEAGLPLDGRFLVRLRMYANEGRSIFHRTERMEMERRGFDQEQNILAPADHCGGCLGETARGVVPIGELVPIGSRTCLTNCRCRIRYINSATGEVAA